jgi:hypothetical protein
MTENRNVPDTNIDLVVKGENHEKDFNLEQFYNSKNKQIAAKDVSAEIQRLKSTLTGNLLDDAEIQQQIYALKLILNPEIAYKPELNKDDDCLYCGS